MESNSPPTLIWIDLEMSGLDTDKDVIIEVACIVTDDHLNVISEGPEIAISQPESIIESMDEWNTNTHTKSGLIDRIRQSKVNTRAAEVETLTFLKGLVAKGTSPMCGNSICQDRRFLHRQMPELETFFHYRNLDVSSLKELAKRWTPDILKNLKKENKHTAKADILESIEELRYYREHFIQGR